jgi:hypothetical protein
VDEDYANDLEPESVPDVGAGTGVALPAEAPNGSLPQAAEADVKVGVATPQSTEEATPMTASQ